MADDGAPLAFRHRDTRITDVFQCWNTRITASTNALMYGVWPTRMREDMRVFLDEVGVGWTIFRVRALLDGSC